MLPSAFEIAGRDLRRAAELRAQKALTPQHAAAEAAVAVGQGDGERQPGDAPAESAGLQVAAPAEPGFTVPHAQPEPYRLAGQVPSAHLNRGALLREIPASLSARMGHVTSDAAPPAAEIAGKAFRDAMPGPAAFPAPSAMSPDQGRPASWPSWQPGGAVPHSTLNAVDFRRGPLMDGQAAPSPSYVEGQCQ